MSERRALSIEFRYSDIPIAIGLSYNYPNIGLTYLSAFNQQHWTSDSPIAIGLIKLYRTKNGEFYSFCVIIYKFCNTLSDIFVLTILSFVFLRCVQLRFVTFMYCDVYVVCSYVMQQLPVFHMCQIDAYMAWRLLKNKEVGYKNLGHLSL